MFISSFVYIVVFAAFGSNDLIFGCKRAVAHAAPLLLAAELDELSLSTV